MTLHTFMCGIMYMPQKNQSAGAIKRSKHDYCNRFNNETIIKLYMSLETYKFLLYLGILVFLYIYIRNIKTKIRIQEQYHYSTTVYQGLPST